MRRLYFVKPPRHLIFTLHGAPAALPMDVPVRTGGRWDALGSPYVTDQTLSDVIELLDSAGRPVPFEANDLIKGQGAFTQYYAGYGFCGPLRTIAAGAGIKLKLHSHEPRVLRWKTLYTSRTSLSARSSDDAHALLPTKM